MVAELVFWIAIASVVYAYVGYPCALWLLASVRRRDVRRAAIAPDVTFVITAYNEELRLAHKIENTLGQDYRGAIEVIVASDCSTDRTDDIALQYAPRVRLVRAGERGGKEAAQRLAVRSARGRILIFSDVATALDLHGVSTIVKNFADDTVGCVSSVDRFIDPDGKPSGEGAYVRYEMLLRKLETRANTVVGLSGSFFAVRRELAERWPTDRQSDFTMLLESVEQGWRGVLDEASVGYYRNIVDEHQEFQRKIRTVVRGLFVLATHRRLLNPFAYGLFAWQLASHKLCRWLVPFLLIVALLANLVLLPRSPIYQIAWLLQMLFYIAAAIGWWTRAQTLRVPTYFVVANLAVFIAWFRFLRGDRIAAWSPSERVARLPPARTP